MNLACNMEYALRVMEGLIGTPSLPCDCEAAFALLQAYTDELGLTLTSDHRGNRYVTLEGEDNTKTVMLAGHMDTVGLMVRKLLPNGTIRASSLGGTNPRSVENELVTIHTASGRKVTGILYNDHHSMHFPETANFSGEHSVNNLHILLDEDVRTAEDAAALGIAVGDGVSVEPHFRALPSGYISSRFLDDKACIACMLAAVKALKEAGAKPKHRTILAFTIGEEVGQNYYVPGDVSEYVAIDVGLLGAELNGTEHDVTLVYYDKNGPYDKKLVTRLYDLAKRNGIGVKTDVYWGRLVSYGTDAITARMGGADVLTAAFGPGTYGTHGLERTHVDAIDNTVRLICAYLLDA